MWRRVESTMKVEAVCKTKRWYPPPELHGATEYMTDVRKYFY
jgi:hypothetical protein